MCVIYRRHDSYREYVEDHDDDHHHSTQGTDVFEGYYPLSSDLERIMIVEHLRLPPDTHESYDTHESCLVYICFGCHQFSKSERYRQCTVNVHVVRCLAR
jgi:hypothetical protein